MLQKGFLMSHKTTQEKKKSNEVLLLAGAVCFILGAIIILLQANYYVGLGSIVIGSVMASAGLWMNVIAQNKNRRF